MIELMAASEEGDMRIIQELGESGWDLSHCDEVCIAVPKLCKTVHGAYTGGIICIAVVKHQGRKLGMGNFTFPGMGPFLPAQSCNWGLSIGDRHPHFISCVSRPLNGREEGLVCT